MLNRIIYGDDILVQAKSLAIKALYIKWKTLSQLKRLTLTDFFEGDDKISRNSVIMLHIGADDYVVIHHGSEHRKAVGTDLSGRLISESDTRMAREMRPIYEQVREMGMPVRLVYAAEGAKFVAGWERIILPLKIAGEVRILLAYSETLALASDVHNFLFDHSPHMLIVALPISTFDNETVDADIIQINPAATRFFNVASMSELPIRLRQLTPWFDDDETWRMLTTSSDRVWECALGASRNQGFRCLVVRLEYLLVFRIHLVDAAEMVTIE
jgi:PAS domain-containing protein